MIIGALVTALLFGGTALAITGMQNIPVGFRDIKIVVDGEVIIPTDATGRIVEPFIYEGTTYVPARAIGEALGKEVKWDAASDTVYIIEPGRDLTPDGKIDVDGGVYKVDAATVFSFTPNKTGIWEFRTSDNGKIDPYLELYSYDGYFVKSDDDSGGDANAIMSVYLTGGETYLLCAEFYGEDIGSYLLTVSIRDMTPKEKIGGDGGAYKISDVTVFSFTPGTSDYWEFRTSDNGDSDPYLGIYSTSGYRIGEDDDMGGNGNAALIVYLTQGETYLICAEFYGNDTGSYLLTVSPGKHIPDEGGNMRITKHSIYVFTPARSGTWELKTSNNVNSDPAIVIYDLEGNYITDDDDSGGDWNALVTTELSSDTAYLVYVWFYDDDGTGACDMTVTRK